MKKAFKKDNAIVVHFGGQGAKESLKLVQGIPGRLFTSRTWTVPLLGKNIKFLQKHGFDIDTALLQMMQSHDKKWTTIGIPEKYNFLRAYQKECLQFAHFHKGRALFSLDMGLGKTLTSLSYADWKDDYPILVISPATVKEGWLREYKEWFGRDKTVRTLYGRDSLVNFNGTVDVVITNFDIFSYHVKKEKVLSPKTGLSMLNNKGKPRTKWVATDDLKAFIKNKFSICIIDECQRIKNEKSKSYLAIKKLVQKIPTVMALSGTPIESKPAEFYNILNILRSDLFPNRYKFLKKYCAPKHNGFGWTYNGVSNADELNTLLKDEIMVRYLKTEVATELEPKIKTVIPINIDSKNTYFKHAEEIKAQLEKDKSKAKALLLFNFLKQEALKAKMKEALNHIKDLVNEVDKVVIFTMHKEAVEEVMSFFGSSAVKVDGSIPSKLRQNIVDAFVTNPKLHVFVGNIKAAGTGLNGLQKGCSTAIFLEFPWTPTAMDQAEDRVFRIGQNENVNIFYILAQNTIDEDIIEIIDEKRAKISSVLDGGDLSENDMIQELMKRFLAKEKLKIASKNK